MKSINNTKLFNYCIKHSEPIIDDAYIKKGNLIISRDPNNPTETMKNHSDLLESLTIYNYAKRNNDSINLLRMLKRIEKIIEKKYMNYSEFISFWSIADMSYSQYKKINKNKRLNILKKIVDNYLELRQGIYLNYGYSPIILQAGKDAKAHKESGSLGINKVARILKEFGYVNSDKDTIEQFISKDDKKFITTDKTGKKIFLQILKYYKIKFLWSIYKENKMPDVLFKNKKDIFIVEHKHMKEGGGGQNKQINEIISLIGYEEKNVNIHYISFLDGTYFNLLIESYKSNNKIHSQLVNIKKNLRLNQGNYFVNTAGFIKLIRSLN